MDLNYLIHREGVERLRADRAASEPARTSHLALAGLFRDRIDLCRRAILARQGLGSDLRLPRI